LQILKVESEVLKKCPQGTFEKGFTEPFQNGYSSYLNLNAAQIAQEFRASLSPPVYAVNYPRLQTD